MNWWPGDDVTFSLGWYQGTGLSALKEKLTQFPPGSKFNLTTTKLEQQARQATFSEVENEISADAGYLQMEVQH
jgi:hypothetical protein